VAPFFTFSPTTIVAQENDIDELEEEREALQDEIDALNRKIEEYSNELVDRRAEITSLQGQITAINTRINKINTEITRTQKEIDLTRITIGETQSGIEEKSAIIYDRRLFLAELLRRLDTIDNESLLEKLLKYESLTQVFAEMEQIATLQKNIGTALDETRTARRELEGKKVVLEESETLLTEKQTELAVQRGAEAQEREHRNTILTATQQEEAQFQALLNQVEAERAAFLDRMLQIEQQIAISRNFQSYFKAGTIPPPGTKLFIWPEDNAVLTQGYGMTAFARRGAYGGTGHNGIDLSAGLAAPVRAAAGGTIAAKGARACIDYVNPACNGYWGNWVAIEHPGGLVTLYAHMSKPSPRTVGESVSAGDIIGYEGATGNITGPHLHFTVYTEFFTYRDPNTGEMRFSYNYGKTLNPLDYL
jgi:murein DD-endopeptidase MepM/ murein hydrolase activator NlpD